MTKTDYQSKRNLYLIKIGGLFTAIMLLCNGVVSAQDLPCEGDDPYDGCVTPLDTYIYIIAFIALAYGVWYLHKNKKSLFA